MDNTFNMDSPYLEHYGILGMKWGIRRYQNPDGTLTPAGRRRVKKAMRQHDIAMSSRDPHDKDREYKKFRDIVTSMYPAEVADLTLKVEQAERLRKLSEIKEEDKIAKGLQYAASIADITSKTMTSLSTFSVAANNFQKMKERSFQIQDKEYDLKKKKENDEKSLIDSLKDGKKLLDSGKDLADSGKDLVKSVEKAINDKKESDKRTEEINKAIKTETEEQRKERERRQKSVPDSARTDYKEIDDAIFRELAVNGVNKQELFSTFADNYNTTISNTPQADRVKSLVEDYANYNWNPHKLKKKEEMQQSNIFKMDGNFYIIPKNSDLVHHGVLGMKWGVRRYQNKDGSLTSAGRKRYGQDGFRSIQQYQNRLNDIDTAQSILNKKIETRQNIKDKLISSKARADAFIDFDGGTVGERVKSKVLNRAIGKVDESINSKLVAKEKGYQEMADIIQHLQNSGFKITTKPTTRNVNSGADYVANLIAGPGAAAALGFATMATIPLSGPVLAPLAGGLVAGSILSGSVYGLVKNTAKGNKFKIEEGG